MLFNSFEFLFGFLPLAFLAHWLVERFAPQWRLPLLVVLSLLFYGYWDWRFVPLLALSIVINWALAIAFVRSHFATLIVLAIAINLAVLGFFKYAGFFASLAFGVDPHGPAVFGVNAALPLGISFFTFHHVMYLVDLRAGKAPKVGLIQYALYISFFPQLLAGPLVRWSEVLPQFSERPYARSDAAERAARGLILLVIGLAKKVLLGDPLAAYVNPIFEAAAKGGPLTVLDAWQATLGFAFQIYFDFSGYTDMALGIALLFGIVLPQNFTAPYRAASLRDFWRRWHMTLSRFLRDYLYVPLGGNRSGLAIQIMALLATMGLGGLWHGAGLTFVAWGLVHGVGLAAGVIWRRMGLAMPAALGWPITFLFVTLSWVLFRASNFDVATQFYKALAGFAPLGATMKWELLAAGFGVAVLGPTAWDAAHRLPLWRTLAVAFAAVTVLILFKIGDDANYDFIYFQF